MKKKKLLFIAGLIAALAVGYVSLKKDQSVETVYSYAKVTKGNINITVASTGTLEATSTIEVGTQVSGKISKILADFNDEVKKGQLLAVIDTVTLVAQVKDARANLAKINSEYNLKKIIYEKNKQLFEKNYISELDLLESKTEMESVEASVESAKYALERAVTNLNYAYIYSPISGKIIDRNIEEGQTVAASFSAPTLFTIAQDLSSMRILASVDESDIGDIREGQKATFNVQSYSDKNFDGVVKQIRLKPTTSSNVVNYTVVVEAENKDKILLPGMTATVYFLINSKENILLVPNTALKFNPSEDLMNQVMANMKDENPGGGPMPPPENKIAGTDHPPMNSEAKEQNGEKMPPANFNKIFYKNESGKILFCPVVTGLTDGKNTEIVFAPNIKEGLAVIVKSGTDTAEKSNTNSLLNRGPGGGMPPPPM